MTVKSCAPNHCNNPNVTATNSRRHFNKSLKFILEECVKTKKSLQNSTDYIIFNNLKPDFPTTSCFCWNFSSHIVFPGKCLHHLPLLNHLVLNKHRYMHCIKMLTGQIFLFDSFCNISKLNFKWTLSLKQQIRCARF